MKKLALLLAIMMCLSAVTVAPASAVTLSASSAAALNIVPPAPHVLVTVKASKPARVYTKVYKAGRYVRSLRPGYARNTYKVTWDFRDAAMKPVYPGLYTYTATVIAGTSRVYKKGSFRVPYPTPVPAPTTEPTTTPTGTPTAGSPTPVAPVGETTTAPAPAPVPAPAPAPTTSGRWVGYYPQGNLSTTGPLDTLEAQTGRKAKVVQLYVADAEGFPTSRAKTITDRGGIPLITWEFWSIANNGGAASIANGSKDAYIRSFATAAKATGKEIWLRPLHEMNSNWYPWAGATNGNTAADVIAAWRRIDQVVDSTGATNVKLVWCPNSESVPNTTANAIEKYWPGDAYVDLLAIDGYNFGTTASWATWRSFSTVMSTCYSKVTALSSKPLFLAEVGSVEQGGSKAAWITDMFAKIKTNYPRIQGVVWFNVNDTKTGQDFRIDSSATSLSAFKNAATTF